MLELSRLSRTLTHEFSSSIDDGLSPRGLQIEEKSLLERTQILMVDRDSSALDRMEACLKDNRIEVIQSCFDAEEALHLVGGMTPDIVVVDTSSGLELLQSFRRLPSMLAAGIIVTGQSISCEQKLNALQQGANTFLAKPVNPQELILSIRNIVESKAYHDHLSSESLRLATEVRDHIFDLEAARVDADAARQEAMHCLARAAEFRDDDTSNHVLRVGRYTSVVARRFAFDDRQIEMIEQAAHLHDVGKIGISDTVLLKPGKLTDEEFDKMREHCEYGSKIILPMTDLEWEELLNQPERTFDIIRSSNAPVMKLAALIARTHHERWDGSGYPLGLKGEQIPLVGRITAIADVFDALSTKRPYKPAFAIEKCFRIIREGRGSHFDPAVVDAFFQSEQEILETMQSLSD